MYDKNNNPVTKPKHYQGDGVECFDALESMMSSTEDGFLSFCWGNAVKYLWRWKDKGGTDDLEKCGVYLEKMLTIAKGSK